MRSTTWKNAERRVAEELSKTGSPAERIPITGRHDGTVPDIKHRWLCPEVKHRKRLPALLMSAMAQAVKAAKKDQLPIVVLHERGKHHPSDMVVVRMKDFLEWFGGAPQLEGGGEDVPSTET